MTHKLRLKIREAKSHTLNIDPLTMEKILSGDESSIKEIRKSLDYLEKEGKIYIHDKEHLRLLVNNVKGCNLRELFYLMKLSSILEKTPENREVNVNISKYLIDLLVKRLETINLERINDAFAGFGVDLINSARISWERDNGEYFEFEIQEEE